MENVVWQDSRDIAREFGRKHYNVMHAIRLLGIDPVHVREGPTVRGGWVSCYLMTPEFADRLRARFSKFSDFSLFDEESKNLLSDGWVESRSLAKEVGVRHNNLMFDLRAIGVEGEFREGARGIGGVMFYLISPELTARLRMKFKGDRLIVYRTKEKAALDAIEQILGIKLDRQFRVGRYRIDGYDASGNVAYEIDERPHSTPSQQAADSLRQREIESTLKCSFKRIKV